MEFAKCIGFIIRRKLKPNLKTLFEEFDKDFLHKFDLVKIFFEEKINERFDKFLLSLSRFPFIKIEYYIK